MSKSHKLYWLATAVAVAAADEIKYACKTKQIIDFTFVPMAHRDHQTIQQLFK